MEVEPLLARSPCEHEGPKRAVERTWTASWLMYSPSSVRMWPKRRANTVRTRSSSRRRIHPMRHDDRREAGRRSPAQLLASTHPPDAPRSARKNCPWTRARAGCTTWTSSRAHFAAVSSAAASSDPSDHDSWSHSMCHCSSSTACRLPLPGNSGARGASRPTRLARRWPGPVAATARSPSRRRVSSPTLAPPLRLRAARIGGEPRARVGQQFREIGRTPAERPRIDGE